MIAALAVFIAGAQFFGQAELIVPVTLEFISMLTLPHMVVVERLWAPSQRPKNRRVSPAAGAA